MATTGHPNDIGVPYGHLRADPEQRPPVNIALLWRTAALIAIPLLVWALTGGLHDRIPQTAAGLSYDVVVNKVTGNACIHVKNEPTPESLLDLACN